MSQSGQHFAFVRHEYREDEIEDAQSVRSFYKEKIRTARVRIGMPHLSDIAWSYAYAC
jgi:hypothetical protein